MTTISLFGRVGDDITAKDIADQISQADDQLTIRVNSSGGSLFEALAIHQALTRHGNATVDIEGAALSAAAVISMAGKRIRMTPASLMMIHLPFNEFGGTIADHEQSIEMLKRAEESTVGIFARRTGLPQNRIRQMLESETWLSAEEAIKLGFADGFVEFSGSIAADFNSWDAVVDHTQRQLQRNQRLTVSRGTAMTEARRRHPALHRQYIEQYNQQRRRVRR